MRRSGGAPDGGESVSLTAVHALLIQRMGPQMQYTRDAIEAMSLTWKSYPYSGNVLSKKCDELVVRGYILQGVHPNNKTVPVYYVNSVMDIESDWESEDAAAFADWQERTAAEPSKKRKKDAKASETEAPAPAKVQSRTLHDWFKEGAAGGAAAAPPKVPQPSPRAQDDAMAIDVTQTGTTMTQRGRVHRDEGDDDDVEDVDDVAASAAGGAAAAAACADSNVEDLTLEDGQAQTKAQAAQRTRNATPIIPVVTVDGQQLTGPVPSQRARERVVGTVRKQDSNRHEQHVKFDNHCMGSDAEVDKRLQEMAVGGVGIEKVSSRNGRTAMADGSLSKAFVVARVTGFAEKVRVAVLWCCVCHKHVSANRVKCGEHCLSDAHARNLRNNKSSLGLKLTMSDFLKTYRRSDAGKFAHGSTVSDKVDSRRLEVTWNCLMAGIPLHKLASTDEDGGDEDDALLAGRLLRSGERETLRVPSFLRMLLEQGDAGALTDPAHLKKDYLPLIRDMERSRIRGVLRFSKPKPRDNLLDDDVTPSNTIWIAIMQDTTPRVDNHWGVVIRFVDESFRLFEVAVELSKWADIGDHEKLCTAMVRLLQERLYAPPGAVIGWMGDRCAVNGAALKKLFKNNISGIDGKCGSHTLDLCAEKFYCAFLLEFSQLLVAMLTSQGGVNKAARYWAARFGHAFRPPNKIRWWSTEEMWFGWVEISFAALCDYIRGLPEGEAEGGGEADENSVRLRKLRAMIDDEGDAIEIGFELSVNACVMKHLVEATYVLEGSRPSLPLIHAQQLQRVRQFYNNHWENVTFPGIQAAIDEASNTFIARQPTWIAGNVYNPQHPSYIRMTPVTLAQCKLNFTEKVRQMTREVVDTLNQKFFVDAPNGAPAPCINDLRRAVIFESLNPIVMRTKDARAPDDIEEDIRWLNTIGRHTFFSDDDIDGIVAEFPAFINDAKLLEVRQDDLKPVPQMERVEEFWKYKRLEYPSLAKLLRFAYTFPVSSASVERLFSKLKQAFSLQQMMLALEDYVEASVLLQFNRRFILAYPDINQ